MKVTYDNEKKLLKLQINEEIDHCVSEKIRGKADYEIQKYMPQKVIMDFENVSFMDSAGIGMLVGRYKTAKMLGCSIEIENIKPNIRKVLEMSGVLKIIPIVNE